MPTFFRATFRSLLMLMLVCANFPAAAREAAKQSIHWKGHDWQVTNGRMVGVVPASGDNVFVDANGFLHLRIVRNAEGWSAAELFTHDQMSFGTYQWQIEGPVDALDPAVVLGLFTYSPFYPSGGVPGENEIDIEFSRWNDVDRPNASFTIWPPTGFVHSNPDGELVPAHEHAFDVKLPKPKLVTARTYWSSRKVVSTVMLGLQPPTSVAQVVERHVFEPQRPKTKIPQVAAPVGINLWCFEQAPATEQEVIIHDFTFIPMTDEKP